MKKVGDLLRQFLEARGWVSGDPYSALFTGWAGVVGDPLAAHCTLAEVEDGVLVVDVDHPGWLQMVPCADRPSWRPPGGAAPTARITGLRARIGR